ncbi:MAG: peptidyl-prolyl cis-trans isomerase [Sphingomonadales bacterium]|nr:peptidyl-prolyl cis-trans isomerase [Sphingomonadales bacterium]MDE2568117.1 peptidyl-prolyl cis-trans isomerase [Sphingomonadales bacterium]
MLGLFRNFFNSRFGVGITLAFLVLIAIAFASADVTGGNFGGIAGGEVVAHVGKGKIGTAEVQQTARAAFDNARQKDPALTMPQFFTDGGLDDLIGGMIERLAVWEWGEQHDMAVSNRLVGSELAQIPAFQGPDGKFNDQTYRAAIAQRRLTDQTVRDDVSKGLMARLVLTPATYGVKMPREVLMRYVALFKEKREGDIAILPSALFVPKSKPDDKTLESWYKSHTDQFIQPERRVLRYAIVDATSLKNVPAPTDAEIAQRYKDNSAVFAPSETRTLTQLIVPTQDAAQAIAAEVAKGASLEASAKSKGLETAHLDKMSKASLAGQTSQAIADAAFAAAKGTLLAPARGPLGWILLHVDAIESNPGKTLEQARPELVKAMTMEAQRKALSDAAASADDKFSTGSSLADIARDLGVEIKTTPPLVSSGEVFGKPGQQAPEEVKPLLNAAFSMEREGSAQVAAMANGTSFAIFDVSQITASAPAPFAEAKDAVLRNFMLDHGFDAAKAASDKVLAALAKGKKLAEALKEAGAPMPPPQHIAMTREELSKSGNRIPPALALMFSMARNTDKRLEAPNHMGWFIVALDTITPGEVKPDDPLIDSGQSDLSSVQGRELSDSLRKAIVADVGSKRNAAAVAAVRKQLFGQQ